MLPSLRWLIAVMLGMSGLVLRAAGTDAGIPPAAPPALREGVLSNGLRYVILPHAAVKGDISLRLVVRAGSLDERDDERGFAHFVEHMAFQGTRRFPPGTIRYFFQHLGLTFGADLNAGTTYTHTYYAVDLPEGRADKFAEALAVMRDYADGLLFPPEQVTREAGVVNSERQARDNNASRIRDQVIEVQFEGTPLPERNPIGLADQIERATADQLRAFYRRNYTPDRMTLLIVGPVDVPATTAAIATEFVSFTAGPERTAPAPGILPRPVDGITSRVVMPPAMKGANVDFSAVRPRAPATEEGRRRELIERIVMDMVQTRLVARRERETSSRFGPVTARQSTDLPGPFVAHSMSIAVSATDWSNGIAFLETELRRASTQGFSQAEVDEAVAIELNAQHNRIADFSGRSSDRVAGEVMRVLMQNGSWRAPETAWADSTRALRDLTAAEATAVLNDILPANALRITLVITPDNVVKPERLTAVYASSSRRALKKGPAEGEELAFQYDDLGPPGTVAATKRVADLDLTLVAFANGVQFNFRPSDFEPGRFRLRVVFPQNYSDVPKDLGGLADLAGQLLVSGNLGKHSASEVERLVNLHGIRLQFTVSNGTPILGVSGPAEALRFALHLLTAYLDDASFDPDRYRVALGSYGSRQLAFQKSASGLAMNGALYHHLQKDARVIMNSGQFFNRVPPGKAESWLRDYILRGPLEVGLVGDLAAEDVVEIATGSLGTLNPRRPAPRRGVPLRPVTTAVRVQETADLPASAAVSCVLWPVHLPDDVRHNVALTIAVDAFRDRLLLALREILGASYAPQATVYRDHVQRDFAFAAMVSTFDPPKARQMTEGCIRLAGIMAEKGVSESQFARLREPLRIRHAENLRDNGWWLNEIVCVAQSRPEVLEIARRHAGIIDEITLEEVNQAAQIFQPANVTVAIVLPEPPKP